MIYTRQRISLTATALVLIALALSALGLVLAQFTPHEKESVALALPAIGSAGLVIGAVIVFVKLPHIKEPVSWAGRLWITVAYATAGLIVVAAIIVGIADVFLTALILGVVAIQGPVAAYLLGRHMLTNAR